MNITDVNNRVKGSKDRKRRGRGAASGLGKTAGRGQKGDGSRAGSRTFKGFTGGQTPLRQRLPKRGFNNANFRSEYIPLNLAWFEKTFEAGSKVGLEQIAAAGIKVTRATLIKVLGTGEISKGLTISAHAFSKSAQEKIEKAGGKIEIIEIAPAAENKA